MNHDNQPLLADINVKQQNLTESERCTTRRAFLAQCVTSLAGFTVVGVVAPLLQGCEPSNYPTANNTNSGTTGGNNSGNNSSTGTAFSVASLTADGQALVTQTKGPDGYRIMLVRIAATEFKALSMRCTHEGCGVNTPQGGTITCGCHGSQFELNGAVKRGPATQPLKSYTTTFDAASNTVKVVIA